MATFISTVKFTDQGLQAIRETVKRSDAFKATAKMMGIKVSGVYWTLGMFDGFIVFDAPNDETATAAMLHLSAQGNAHTTTVRAFEAGEIEKILGILPKK
jgi:uncharacterized protein with GYD domain